VTAVPAHLASRSLTQSAAAAAAYLHSCVATGGPDNIDGAYERKNGTREALIARRGDQTVRVSLPLQAPRRAELDAFNVIVALE